MVDKTLDYVEAMHKMVWALPDVEHYRKEFVFYLSVEFAQGLLDYQIDLVRLPAWEKRMKSGDEFTWMGFKCKVV